MPTTKASVFGVGKTGSKQQHSILTSTTLLEHGTTATKSRPVNQFPHIVLPSRYLDRYAFQASCKLFLIFTVTRISACPHAWPNVGITTSNHQDASSVGRLASQVFHPDQRKQERSRTIAYTFEEQAESTRQVTWFRDHNPRPALLFHAHI